MSFPINTAVPAAANNPSVDQPEMLLNFQNIDGFLQVDHRDPGAAQAGQHDQVRFASNQAAPALNSAVGEVYTNSLAGIIGSVTTLLFNTGSDLRLTNLALTQNSTVTGGSGTNYGVTTPWGLILNFGTVNIGGTNTATVTFALPMTTARYAIVTGLSFTSAGSSNVVTFGLSSTQVSLNTTRANRDHYYIALGK